MTELDLTEMSYLEVWDDNFNDPELVGIFVTTRPLTMKEHRECKETFAEYRRLDSDWTIEEINMRIEVYLIKIGILIQTKPQKGFCF